MPFPCLQAVAAGLILLAFINSCSGLSGTRFGVTSTLKAILFQCSNRSHENSKGDRNCEPYLAINIETEPNFHVSELHQFLILDQIYVASRFSTAKLLAPYIIEISRGEPLLMCPLEYDRSFNIGNGLPAPKSNRYSKGGYQETDQFIFNGKSLNYRRANAAKNSRNQTNFKIPKRYSVFKINLPTPFLVTKIQIFQKRYSTWWRLTPSVTVDSSSGFYASGNLAVWFKYHFNIFQESKSINRLKNFKIFLPPYNNGHPKPQDLLNIAKESNELMFYYSENDLKQNHSLPALEKSPIVSRNAQMPGIERATFLENCPHNNSMLCAHVLDDVVAGYSLKIRLPFVENDFIKANVFKVKIINVVTDATVKDALKITINLVNEGLEVQEFAVGVDCLKRIRNNQASITKKLLPHVGETVTIFSPFIFKKSRQIHCNIQVSKATTEKGFNRWKYAQRDEQNLQNQRMVTSRKIAVMPSQRCLCVWKCGCHCLAKLETSIDYNICRELDALAQSKAGLLNNSNYYELNEKDSEEDSKFNIQSFIFECFSFAIQIFLLMGFLGFCKATTGICIPCVDKLGYDYLQPARKFADTSKLRHFLINLFYFILLPFLICCNCFTPPVEDLLVFYDSDPTAIIIEETAAASEYEIVKERRQQNYR